MSWVWGMKEIESRKEDSGAWGQRSWKVKVTIN